MTAPVYAMKTTLATSTTHPVRKPGQAPRERPTQVYPLPQFGSVRFSRAYDSAMPRMGRTATISSAGVWRPAYSARAPMPMPMLVVAAVLDAAMAMPSRTPSVRRICGTGGFVPGGATAMVRSFSWRGGGAPMKQPRHTYVNKLS